MEVFIGAPKVQFSSLHLFSTDVSRTQFLKDINAREIEAGVDYCEGHSVELNFVITIVRVVLFSREELVEPVFSVLRDRTRTISRIWNRACFDGTGHVASR